MPENEFIRLRALEPEDLEILYRWENEVSLWRYSNTCQPFSRFALKQYIQESEKTIYESLQLRFMIERKADNVVVGTVDLYDFDTHNSRVALGLYTDSAYQGNGYATMALHLTESYIFDFLHIHQLYCFISASNIPSVAMFRKEKYLEQAILKHWIRTPDGYEDIIVFQRFSSR
jgi:diamine N-acetyltransferase